MDGARPNVETTWEDDLPGNQYDTDETVLEVLTHNEIYDRLCRK